MISIYIVLAAFLFILLLTFVGMTLYQSISYLLRDRTQDEVNDVECIIYTLVAIASIFIMSSFAIMVLTEIYDHLFN